MIAFEATLGIFALVVKPLRRSVAISVLRKIAAYLVQQACVTLGRLSGITRREIA